MRHEDARKRLPAVNRAVHPHVQDVHHVRVLRVREHVDVVPGPLDEVAVSVDERPVISAVVGAVQPSLLRLDQCIDPAPVAPGHRHADSSQDSTRQSVALQALPCASPVGGFIQPAAGPAIRQSPGCAICLPQRGKDDMRIRGVERQVDGPRFVVLVEHLFPCLPAVERAEDSTLRVRPELMSQGRHEHDVRVFRVHDQPPDLP